MIGGRKGNATVRVRPVRSRQLAAARTLLRMQGATSYGRRVTGRRNRLLALALWHRDNGRCGRCGLPIDLRYDWRSRYALTIGHIRPHSRGGTYDPANLRPEHRGCNLSGGTRDARPMPRVIAP